jgi:outer membrane cobalamin receptor
MRGRVLLLLLISLMMIYLSQFIWAQENGEAMGEDPETVVTATRTPEKKSQTPGESDVVTKEEIKESEATFIDEVLMDNGYVISTNGGMSQVATIQLDGCKSEQTLVLMNGVPMNTGLSGVVDISYLPTTGIERIEVAHGPLSSLYGSSAIGGVVNIITDLTGDPFAQFSMNTGSFHTNGLNLRFQEEKWGLAFGGNRTGGYRENSENRSYYLLGQYDIKETDEEYLKLYWQLMNKAGEDPGHIAFPLQAERSEDNYGINLNGAHRLWGGRWEYKLFTQYLDYHYHDYGNSQYDRHETYHYGFDMAGSYNFGKHQLLPGLMIRREQLASTMCGDRFRNDFGLFIQDSWQLHDRLKLVAGLRQDFYSDYASPLSPKFSLIVNVSEEVTLKLGYGKTFRVPTFGDLYWNEPGLIGNPNLKPEKGERYDLVGEWRRNQQSLSINIYRSKLWDGLDWQPIDPDAYYPDWHVVNVSKVHTQGVNIQWENQLFEILTARIGYNLLDKKGFDPLTQRYSQDLNHFGKHQFNLGLGLKYNQWTSQINWYYVANRNNRLPDYNVVNLNMRYALSDGLRFSLDLDNLGDQEYEINQGYPMPERSFSLGITYEF